MLVYQSVFFAAPALRSPTRRSAHLWQWPRRPAEQRRTRRLGGFQKPKFLGVPHGENHGKNGENHGIILEKPWEKLEKTLERFQKEWWNGIWCGKALESGLLWANHGKVWRHGPNWPYPSTPSLFSFTKFCTKPSNLWEKYMSESPNHPNIFPWMLMLGTSSFLIGAHLISRHHSQWFHPTDFFTQDIPAK